MKSFWKKYGHNFVLFGAGVLIVLLGYGVGNLVFRNAEEPKGPPEEIIAEVPDGQKEAVDIENPEEEIIQEDPEETDEEQDGREIKEVKLREIVAYEIIEREDASLEKGKMKVIQEGSLGEIEYTYEVIVENGREVDRNLLSEEYTSVPEDRIIHIGTKSVIKTVTEKVEEEIPFDTIYEEDPSVYVGNLTVKTEGRKGVRTIRYEVTYEDGKEVSREKLDEIITKESVDKVIVTGTKPLDEEPEDPGVETPVG